MTRQRLLTFNCHEPYIHLLAKVGFDLDVIDGLPGRYTTHWDRRSRPVPDNVRLVALEQAGPADRYLAAVCHNVTDLIALKPWHLPKVLVCHVNLHARVAEEQPGVDATAMSEQVRTYLELIRGTAVGVSADKLASWGLEGHVIPPPIDGNDYGGYRGEEAVGLRVANQVSARRERFAWHLHEAVAAAVPVRLIGHNPDLPDVQSAATWDDLREFYRRYRFFLHTAGQGLEDGYNLALLEAMATGMPVVTTPAENSPVTDGENGLVGATVDELERHARALVADRDRAEHLGAAARVRVLSDFPVETFRKRWEDAVEAAVRRFRGS